MASKTAPAPAGFTEDIVSPRGNWFETKFWGFVQWYTSFFYWGAGVFIGLTTGLFHFWKTYTAVLLTDLFHVFDKRAPAAIENAAAIAKTPHAKPPFASKAPTPTLGEKISGMGEKVAEKFHVRPTAPAAEVPSPAAPAPLPHVTPKPREIPVMPAGYRGKP